MEFQPLPQDPILMVHLALVVLTSIFPISKSLHGAPVLQSHA